MFALIMWGFFLHTEETIKNCDIALLRLFSLVNSSKHEVDWQTPVMITFKEKSTCKTASSPPLILCNILNVISLAYGCILIVHINKSRPWFFTSQYKKIWGDRVKVKLETLQLFNPIQVSVRWERVDLCIEKKNARRRKVAFKTPRPVSSLGVKRRGGQKRLMTPRLCCPWVTSSQKPQRNNDITTSFQDRESKHYSAGQAHCICAHQTLRPCF